VVNALACIGSAVDLFSIAKRQHEGFALGSVWHGIAAAPIFVWVLSLGVWLVVKGFTASPITARMAAAGRPPTATPDRRQQRPDPPCGPGRCPFGRNEGLRAGRPGVARDEPYAEPVELRHEAVDDDRHRDRDEDERSREDGQPVQRATERQVEDDQGGKDGQPDHERQLVLRGRRDGCGVGGHGRNSFDGGVT
jgi:hypothetical protein